MPEIESMLGFTNRWYAMAREESDVRELPGRVPVRIVRAPLFLATKVEALASRGAGDFASQLRVPLVLERVRELADL